MNLEKLVIDNIRLLRRKKGISQEQLAAACNTTTSYIGLMETYRNVPKLSTIERIADALGVNPLALFWASDEQQDGEDWENGIQRKKQEILEIMERELDVILRK
jgi:transcriptional regulator with XRE-family HTH domain